MSQVVGPCLSFSKTGSSEELLKEFEPSRLLNKQITCLNLQEAITFLEILALELISSNPAKCEEALSLATRCHELKGHPGEAKSLLFEAGILLT